MSPYQTSENFRFGTEQVNNEPIYTTRPLPSARTSPSRELYIMAPPIHCTSTVCWRSAGGKDAVLAGISGAGFIGLGYNNTGYNGEISEVLVYNRVLTSNEAAGVESYLRNKFGTR